MRTSELVNKKESSESSEESSSSEEDTQPQRRLYPEIFHEEINDSNARKFKKVSDRNATGKLINSIFRMYHRDRHV